MKKFFLRSISVVIILTSVALFLYSIYFVIYYMFIGGIEGIIDGIKNDFNANEIAWGIIKLFFASTVAGISTVFSTLVLALGCFIANKANDIDRKSKMLKTFRERMKY